MSITLLAIFWFLTKIVAYNAVTSEDTVSVLEGVPVLCAYFMPVVCWIISARVLSSEYQEQSYQFVRSLPVNLRTFLACKYLLCLSFLIVCTFMLLSALMGEAAKLETLEPDFRLKLIVQSLTYVFFIWNAFCLTAFLGRYRFSVIILTLVSLLVIFNGVGNYQPSDFPPFAIMNSRTTPYDRGAWPWTALGWTVGFSVLLFLGACFLALWNQGSLVESLRGRLTLKEKSGVALFALLLIFSGAMYDEHREAKPYPEINSLHLSSASLPLDFIYFGEDQEASARKFSDFLEPVILGFKKDVLKSEIQRTVIVFDPDLRPTEYHGESLNSYEALECTANFSHPDFDKAEFTAGVLHSLLWEHSKGTAGYEPVHWFMDGFCHWYAKRRRPDLLSRAQWMMSQEPVKLSELGEWSSLADRVRQDSANALAYALVSFLENQIGEAPLLEIANTCFERPGSQHVGDKFYELSYPLEAQLEERGLKLDEPFWKAFQGWLSQEAETPLGKATASLELKANQADCRLSFASSLPPGVSWFVAHAKAEKTREQIGRNSLQRETYLWPKHSDSLEELVKLPYGSGETVYIYMGITLPSSDYEFVVVPAQRLVVP